MERDPTDPGSASPDELQFDTADVADGGDTATCALCGAPLAHRYWDVNGRPACERCHDNLRREMEGGSRSGRLFAATAAGVVAAALGAGLYYAVLAITGYEVGLVAIVVGFMVGYAVRWGSRGRGGWIYQTLAVGLTYFAIVTTYIPFIIQGMQEMDDVPTEVVEAPTTEADMAEAEGMDAAEEPIVEAVTEAEASLEELGPPTALEIVVGVILLLVIAAIAPFLAGFQNIIGLFIIGIGLYQAWKLNQRVPIRIQGPFKLGEAGPEEPAPA